MSEEMNKEVENDIQAVLEDGPAADSNDPQTISYQLASHIMEEYRPGFVLIGSPHMGETAAGYMYPDSVGIVINHTIGLTQTSMAAILEELARQLQASVDSVEDFLREKAEDETEDE